MRHLVTALRLFFGALMIVNGSNHFLHLFPLPSAGPEATAFLQQLEVSGLFAVVKVLEVIIGVLLLSNFFVPAAIAAAMPIMVVSTYFNLFLLGGNTGYAAGALGIGVNLLLLLGYSQYFVPLLTVRSRSAGFEGLRRWRSNWDT